MIVSLVQDGPDTRVTHDSDWDSKTSGRIVPLKNWSDVNFLEWKHHTYDSKLSMVVDHIIHAEVTQSLARKLIFKVLEDERIKNGPPKWPGIEFVIDTEAGQTLPGTQAGQQTASSLYEHRANPLGPQWIKVSEYSVSSDHRYCIRGGLW